MWVFIRQVFESIGFSTQTPSISRQTLAHSTHRHKWRWQNFERTLDFCWSRHLSEEFRRNYGGSQPQNLHFCWSIRWFYHNTWFFLTNIDMSKFRLKEINVQFYYFLKNSILTTNLISQNKKFQLNSTKFCCWVFLAKIDIFLKLILNVSILLYKNQLLRQNKHLGLPNLAWKWTSTKVGLQNHQFVSRWSYFTHRRNDKFAFWCHNFGQSPQSLSVSMEQKVEAILREFSDNKENQFLFSKLENHQLIWRIKLTSCQLWLFNGKMETSSCQM